MTLPNNAPAPPLPLNPADYQTVIDVLLNRTGRLVQKLLRRPTPPPNWYCALVLFLCMDIFVWLLSALLGNTDAQRLWFLSQTAAGALLAVGTMVLSARYFGEFVRGLCEDISRATTTPDDLVNLRRWLDQFFDLPKAYVICIAYGMFIGTMTVWAMSGALGTFVGFAPALGFIIVTGIGAIPVIYIIRLVLHPPPLAGFQLELFQPNPSESPIIRQIATLFDNFAYLYVINALVYTIATALWAPVGFLVAFLLLSWIPTLAIFAVSNRLISSIITHAKWKTLLSLQAQISAAQASHANKDEIAYLRSLLDFHDYVKRTPDSALDLNTGLRLFRSLLLPVILFLLINARPLTDLITRLFP